MSSENRESTASSFKTLLTALALFLGFGVVAAVVFCSASGHKSIQDKAAAGGFDQKTIDARTQNLVEVTAAQGAVVNREAIAAAEKQIVADASSMKAVKSNIVVPGSPTFLKQMEAASAASAAAKKAAEAPKAPAPAPKALEVKAPEIKPPPAPVAKKPQAAAPKKAPEKPKAPPVKAPPVKVEKPAPKAK